MTRPPTPPSTPLDLGEREEVKRLIREYEEANAAARLAAQRPNAEFSARECDARCEGATLARRALDRHCTPDRISRLVAEVERDREDAARWRFVLEQAGPNDVVLEVLSGGSLIQIGGRNVQTSGDLSDTMDAARGGTAP